MKRIITLLLACLLMLSCAACASHGNPANQEAQLMAFVKKHYGDADIIQKESAILDTATVFMLRDKEDGFEYPMTTLEVYMSDLGFVSANASGNEKTLVIDGQFTMKYVANLVKKKLPHEEFAQIIDAHASLLDVSVFTYEQVANEVFAVETEESAFMMTELNAVAIREMAKLMRQYDKRNILDYYIMPIYKAAEKDGVIEFEYGEDGSAIILGYYDFMLDYVMKPEEFDGVGTLHDYLMGKECKDVVIKAVNLNISFSAVDTEEGFSFLPNINTKGTFIIMEIDGVPYEFHTAPGVKEFTTPVDAYGIHEGSFLDIMAGERTGGRDVLIAYYAMMYPSYYTQMTLHFKPVEIIADEPGNTEGGAQ